MKRGVVAGLTALVLAGSAWTQETNVAELAKPPAPVEPAIEDALPSPNEHPLLGASLMPVAGLHHRVVEYPRTVTSETGEVAVVTNRYVALATGLNRWDQDAQDYIPAEVLFEQLDTGHIIARKTAHQLILSPEIGAEGAVELWGAEGLHLRSSVLGIGVMDAVTGTNYLLAGLREKAALELVSASEVRIEDAFDTWKAALGYRLRLDGVEQDLILQERITPELLTELGVEPKHARVFLMTEFFEPPPPAIQEATLDTPSGQLLADAVLDFGGMQMGPGQAFADGAEAGLASVRVGKEWRKLDGRQFLIETVAYADLAPMMERLPLPEQARADRLKDKVRRTALLPKAKTNRQAKAPRFEQGKLVLGETRIANVANESMKLASVRAPGVIVDYSILTTTATLTLRGDCTYYLLDAVNVSSSLVIEGGCVVKVTNSPTASIICGGTVTCQTDFYRPAYFVSKDEDSLGEAVAGSTGNPWTNYCGSAALELRSSGQNLRHLRFSHLQRGLFFADTSASTHTLSHAQFVHCNTAIQANGYGTTFANLNLRNVLIHKATTALWGYSVTGRAEHLTAHECSQLTWDFNGTNYGTTSALYLTNCVLGNVSGNGNMTVSESFTTRESYSNQVFQTVGGGGFYPVSDQHRANGTTNINATLASEIKSLTTYPPSLLGGDLTGNVSLGLQVARNTGVPDRGFHYPPLDYLCGGRQLTATLVLTNGAAVGFYGTNGLILVPGSKLISQGSPTAPNRLVPFFAAQEMSAVSGWPDGSRRSLLVVNQAPAGGVSAPEVFLRFTEIDIPACTSDRQHFLNCQQASTTSPTYPLSSLTMMDCQVWGARLMVYPGWTGMSVGLTNNFFQGGHLNFDQRRYYGTADFTLTLRNNLFRNLSLSIHYSDMATLWTVKDNLLDTVSLSALGAYNFNNTHNGYLGTSPLPGASNSRTIGSADYQTGPLGRCYYPASGTNLFDLVDKGSLANAADAGLFHFTTRADQLKERTSQIDIGYHYPVLETDLAFGRGSWATQANNYTNDLGVAGPWRAVDGNTDGSFTNASVCHTLSCPQAWWEVDLGAVYSIDLVRVWNRGDGCQDRLTNFYVLVSSSAFASTNLAASTNLSGVGSYYVAGSCGTPSTVAVNRSGRYVRVQLTLTNYLHMAEVEVIKLGTGVVDTDRDGLADYLEDRNGNGAANTGEYSWLSADTDGDQVPDGYEWAATQSGPLVAWKMDLTDPCVVSGIPADLGNVRCVASREDCALAVKASGAVVGWGTNYTILTNIPASLTNAVAVGLGASHGVALKDNGSVVAWGSNDLGQCNVPASLASGVKSIVAGDYHTLALKHDGTVIAWGRTNELQCAVPVNAQTGVTAISAWRNDSLALRTDNQPVGWGANGAQQHTGLPSGVRLIGCGNLRDWLIMADGSLQGWGEGVSGDEIGLPNSGAAMQSLVHSSMFSLARNTDGTLVQWGSWPGTDFRVPAGLRGALQASIGVCHGLAMMGGPPWPCISEPPRTRIVLRGSTAVLSATGFGALPLAWQWKREGSPLTGQTNSTLSLPNVQLSQSGSYSVVLISPFGAVESAEAELTVTDPPVITSQTPAPGNLRFGWNQTLSLSVAATNTAGVAQYYFWKRNGEHALGDIYTNYVDSGLLAKDEGTYWVAVSNAVGGVDSGQWTVRVDAPGEVVGWGSTAVGATDLPLSGGNPTNFITVAAGSEFTVAALESGTVMAWGTNSAGQTNVPVGLTNVTQVAAGYQHALALKDNMTVVAWGANGNGQTNVPASLTNVTQVAAGGAHSLARRSDGSAVAWGGNAYGQTNVPATLTNALYVSAGYSHSLAVRSTGTVVAWGDNSQGQTSIPTNLTNAVAIAAGYYHNLALRADGTVLAWGANGSATNVPAGLSNVLAVAAGNQFSLALKNDGTVVAWGANTYGQTSVFTNLPDTKAIAAGNRHAVALLYNPYLNYPIDVRNDYLVLYNTNSTESLAMRDYYLANRPRVASANTLGIPLGRHYNVTEWTTNDLSSNVLSTALYSGTLWPTLTNWYRANPTKRPSYILLMHGLPNEIQQGLMPPGGSLQYDLRAAITNALGGRAPFLSSIALESTNDVMAYINKLASVGSNSPPGSVYISARRGGRTDDNIAFSNVLDLNHADSLWYLQRATNTLITGGVLVSSVIYVEGVHGMGGVPISSAANVIGLETWGHYGGQAPGWATNGDLVIQGSTQWLVVQTQESFSGYFGTKSSANNHGKFTHWFKDSSFGGTNYTRIAVGGVSSVEEPNGSQNDPGTLFLLWHSGKTLGQAGWFSTPGSSDAKHDQVNGDPLVQR